MKENLYLHKHFFIHEPCDKFCLISLQIYMNDPNFLHIHIKSYMLHNDIQIHNPSHDNTMMLSI
jgi:hypothetical protein